MPVAPSGAQYQLAAGDYRATIVEVGGGVRECFREDRALLQAYPEATMCDGAHGAPLIPWPNRLADGRYRFDDVDYQVALTEPAKHNAIHGFLHWRSWRPIERAADRIVMATRLYPQSGYPFALDVQIEYTLGSDGLTVQTTATNIGDRACPYGCGHHPYLSPGEGEIDECELQMDAATRVLTTPDRGLPTGTEPVSGTRFDFAEPKPVGNLKIDHAFTDLRRDADGRAWARLRGGDGNTVQLWVDSSYPVIELYTADTLAPQRQRRGLAAEPMTCPPNAFQTGSNLTRLEPGDAIVTRWGISLT